MFTDNLYILGSLVDANGDPTRPQDNFNSFFGETEYFTSIELGWVKSLETAYVDNLHMVFWHAAERKQLGIPSGWGLAFSYSHLFIDKFLPFVRAGYANDGGALWDRSISMGCGYRISEMIDRLGLGFNWGRPSRNEFGESINYQFTSENYCHFNLYKMFSATPSIQLLINPALNQEVNSIFVYGFRFRASL